MVTVGYVSLGKISELYNNIRILVSKMSLSLLIIPIVLDALRRTS